MDNSIRLAFEPSLLSATPSLCEALYEALAPSLTNPPSVSIAVSLAPIGPGALAMLMEPPVIPVCIDRHEALIGPLYIPGQSVCPACLDYWLGMNFFDHDGAQGAFDLASLRPLTGAITHCVGVLATHGPRTHALAVAYADWRHGRHAVFARRDCPHCVSVADSLPLDVHCSRWTGIVNAMELTTEASVGAYRATATWAPPLPIDGARPHLERQESYGRGRTAEEACRGCIGEALERYSLVYRGDERFVRAPLTEVAEHAIHPDTIQLFSDAQYRDRVGWNASVEDEWFVPERFDPHTPVDWLPARTLAHQGQHPDGDRDRLVAAACCLMWYEFRPGEPDFARADTVGCASGTTFDDALMRALLEWVERDAMAIWWDNRVRRPGLRLESFDSPDIEAVRMGLIANDRDLFLLDCTTDLGIPAYVAVAPRRDGSEPLIAGAADPSPRIAAWRAVSEVGQVLYEAQRSGGLPAVMREWLLEQSTSRQPYLMPLMLIDAPPEPESGNAQPPGWRPIVERLEAVGLQAYAVDNSRADVLLRTVRAVVPGLRHVWNRHAPGRLYDVPVKMGWLDRPNAEADMNPIPGMV